MNKFVLRLSVVWTTSLILLVAADAQGGVITVSDRANIHGAGHLIAPNPGGGSGGTLPPLFTFTPNSGFVLQVTSVLGTTSLTPGTVYDSVNGEGSSVNPMDITSFGGISGIIHTNRSGFLVGVFLNGSEPVAGTEPARLSFSDPENFTTLSPLLQQTFFIGNGRTESGIVQSFVAPTGASRLYFGFVDGFGYFGLPGQFQDNSGRTLSVTFNDPVAAVPEPSCMAIFGIGILCVASCVRRRNDVSKLNA